MVLQDVIKKRKDSFYLASIAFDSRFVPIVKKGNHEIEVHFDFFNIPIVYISRSGHF